MSLPNATVDAQEAAIRSLLERVQHFQYCIASLFESLERINQNMEILAEANPSLHLVRLTQFPPEGMSRSEPRVRTVGKSYKTCFDDNAD
jgi:hypothetical protein